MNNTVCVADAEKNSRRQQNTNKAQTGESQRMLLYADVLIVTSAYYDFHNFDVVPLGNPFVR